MDRVGLLLYGPGMATVASGHIERLPSGSLRVRVYGGKDPVTGKERRYKRTVKTEAQAATVHRRARAACPRWSRTSANGGEQWGAVLESV